MIGICEMAAAVIADRDAQESNEASTQQLITPEYKKKAVQVKLPLAYDATGAPRRLVFVDASNLVFKAAANRNLMLGAHAFLTSTDWKLADVNMPACTTWLELFVLYKLSEHGRRQETGDAASDNNCQRTRSNRWRRILSRKKKVQAKMPRQIGTTPTLGNQLADFKTAIRRIVAQSGSEITKACFMDARSPVRRLAPLGIKGNHPLIKMQPCLERGMAERITLTILNFKQFATRSVLQAAKAIWWHGKEIEVWTKIRKLAWQKQPNWIDLNAEPFHAGIDDDASPGDDSDRSSGHRRRTNHTQQTNLNPVAKRRRVDASQERQPQRGNEDESRAPQTHNADVGAGVAEWLDDTDTENSQDEAETRTRTSRHEDNRKHVKRKLPPEAPPPLQRHPPAAPPIPPRRQGTVGPADTTPYADPPGEDWCQTRGLGHEANGAGSEHCAEPVTGTEENEGIEGQAHNPDAEKREEAQTQGQDTGDAGITDDHGERRKDDDLVVGTDGSGLDSPVLALRALGIPHRHAFSSDSDKRVRQHLRANVDATTIIYGGILEGNVNRVPVVDLYIAGFPCKPFSNANPTRKGARDPRGTVFEGCAKYISRHRPKAFVLENVVGLMSMDEGTYFKSILRRLASTAAQDDGNPHKYHVSHEVLNACDYGDPQNRPRVYIVGIREDCGQEKFEFPAKQAPVPLEDILDPLEEEVTMEHKPRTQTAKKNHKDVMAKLTALGARPLIDTYCIDVDAGTDRGKNWMHNRSKCLLKCRANAYWISSRGRYLRLGEVLKIRGMNVGMLNRTQGVTDKHLIAMAGNAMSLGVLRALLTSVISTISIRTGAGSKCIICGEPTAPDEGPAAIICDDCVHRNEGERPSDNKRKTRDQAEEHDRRGKAVKTGPARKLYHNKRCTMEELSLEDTTTCTEDPLLREPAGYCPRRSRDVGTAAGAIGHKRQRQHIDGQAQPNGATSRSDDGARSALACREAVAGRINNCYHCPGGSSGSVPASTESTKGSTRLQHEGRQAKRAPDTPVVADDGATRRRSDIS